MHDIKLPIHYTFLEETTSTNDVVLQMGREGAQHFSCVCANSQTAGRGRRGKEWSTYSKSSLACSFLIRAPESIGELLPLVTSLAVCETVQEYVPCSIKWPNDILSGDEKLAGILVESASQDGERFYVVGVGMNINNPQDTSHIIGTNFERILGHTVERSEVLSKLVFHLQKVLSELVDDGWSELKERYTSYCSTIGQTVTWYGAKEVTGVATAIVENGVLQLETESGLIEIRSGEIISQGNERE